MAKDKAELKVPAVAADLDRLLRHYSGVPDRALGVWLRPLIAHIAPQLQGAPIPSRVAEIARLAGVPIAPVAPDAPVAPVAAPVSPDGDDRPEEES